MGGTQTGPASSYVHPKLNGGSLKLVHVFLQVVLREPFVDCELFDVALFLRFTYKPADLTPANLAAVTGSLLGLLHLAHKLDAPQIMQAAVQQMAGEPVPWFDCLQGWQQIPSCC